MAQAIVAQAHSTMLWFFCFDIIRDNIDLNIVHIFENIYFSNVSSKEKELLPSSFILFSYLLYVLLFS